MSEAYQENLKTQKKKKTPKRHQVHSAITDLIMGQKFFGVLMEVLWNFYYATIFGICTM